MFRPLILIAAGVLVVSILLYTQGSSAQAPSRDRLSQPIDNSQRSALPGSVSPLARPQFDRGRGEASMQLHHVSLMFRLSAEQQREFDELGIQQNDPSSVNYHKWLTPEEYADRFGLTTNDLNKVIAWLHSQGLVVEGVSRGRNEVYFGGTAAQVEAALNTELHHYLVRGENHFANATAPSLPGSLSNMVLAVRRLDDFRPKPHSKQISPRFTQGSNHFLSPEDFATIYDLGPLYSSSLDGTGQKIVVVGDSAITLSDISAFRSAAGLSANAPTVVTASGTGSAVHNSDEGEADLDLEWAGAVARNASIIYDVAGSTAPSGAFDALTDAIDNNRAPIVSNSFGLCEADATASGAQSIQAEIQRANRQGQNVTSASGDTGAADCDGDTSGSAPATASRGLSVDVPAAIPEVTGVGGSEFCGDATTQPCNGGGTFWNASNDSKGGSATSYIPEKVWNDTALRGSLAAGGGGKSTFFSKPSFQTSATPADGARDVPDVAINGSADHDGYLVCSKGSCANGFNTSTVFGGTSAGAPTIAGILAIMNQSTGGLGAPVNSRLYTMAGTSAFHDITNGNNIVPCTQNTPSCPASSPFQYGFSATTGYDLASGLGSPDAFNLVNAAGGGGGGGGGNGADFVLSSDPTSISIASPGGTGSSTISVTPVNGFTGSVALSCALVPASSTAQISCTLPSPVTVNGNAPTALLTVLTARSSAALFPSEPGVRWLALGGGVVACFLAIAAPPCRRRWIATSALLLMVGLAVGAGCGGGSSSPTPKTSGTPPGTYSITITATSGSSTTTKNVPVVVH
jgi:pseudomonalisin